MAFDGTKTQVTLFNCLFNWVSGRWLARKNPSVLWWQMCAQACCSILLRPTAECSRITCVFGWAFDFHIYVEYFFCCNSINANKYLSTRECVRAKGPQKKTLQIARNAFTCDIWIYFRTSLMGVQRNKIFSTLKNCVFSQLDRIYGKYKLNPQNTGQKKCVPSKWICMV